MPGYEERTGQLEMAAAIAEAFNSRCNLMYEAGTGTVIAADPRIVTKNYGSVFRKSIPASVRIVTGIDELMDAVGGVLTSTADLGYNSPQMSKENHE